MYEQKPNMQDELIMNDNIITRNAFSGKTFPPLESETLINTGVSELSNHREKIMYEQKPNMQDELIMNDNIITRNAFSGKTFPPLESETLINAGVSELSNHREINDTEFAKTIDHICQKCYNFYVYRQTWRN